MALLNVVFYLRPKKAKISTISTNILKMGRGIRGITRDLYESHGREFQKRSYTWLKFLYPEILDAKDLGEIDREGVDLYIFHSNKKDYEKVFQCKGFEKAFGDNQLEQCIKSIKTFSKAGVWTVEYY